MPVEHARVTGLRPSPRRQLRHCHPPAGLAPAVRHDQRRPAAGGVRVLLHPRLHRRHRRLDRPPHGTTLRCLPRPLADKVLVLGSMFASWPSAGPGVAGGDHRRPRDLHQPLPGLLGPPGPGRPARKSAEFKRLRWIAMAGSFWIETLGCPKNQVDSDKLVGTMLADGLVPADSPEGGRRRRGQHLRLRRGGPPGVDRHHLEPRRRPGPGARLVVTGCMAERYGDELAEALPEVDSVAGFGVPVTLTAKPSKGGAELVPSLDLLNLPRPASTSPWAYVKVAEGCDRACGFCAIPSFRGKQRSRTVADILDEVDALAGPGDRARRPGPRRLRPRPGRGGAGHRPAGARPSPRGSTGSASSTSTRPTSPTR